MITDRAKLGSRNCELRYEVRVRSPYTVDDGQTPPVPVDEWLVYRLHEQNWTCKLSLDLGADELQYHLVELDPSTDPPEAWRLHREVQENRIGMDHPVELWALLTLDNGSVESQRMFAGKHHEIEPLDEYFKAVAQSWSADLSTTVCDLFMESDTTGTALEGPQRLAEVPGFDEGYDDDGTPRFYTYGLDKANRGHRAGFGITYGLNTPEATETAPGGLTGTFRWHVTILVEHDGYEKEVWPSDPTEALTVASAEVVVTCPDFEHPELGRLRFRWYRYVDGTDPWADGASTFIGETDDPLIVDDGISATAGAPPFVRRAWQRNVIRLFYLVKDKSPTDPDGLKEVNGQYFIDDESGLIQFGDDPRLYHDRGPDNDPDYLDPGDPEYLAFYVKGVRCYIEGTNNAKDVIEAILSYPLAQGGFGAESDYLAELTTVYDLTSAVVLQTQDLDLFVWEPKNGTSLDALKTIQKALRPNFRYWTNHATGDLGRFRAEYIVQDTDPETGDRTYDLELLPITQGSLKIPKNLQNIYTRIQLPYTKERPTDWMKTAEIIFLLEPGVLHGAQTETAGQMMRFLQGENVDTATNESWRIVDGSPNTGFGASDLPNSGIDPYGEPYLAIRSEPLVSIAYGWVTFLLADLYPGAPYGDPLYNRPLEEIVFYGGGSRNPKAVEDTGGIFTTGARIWGARSEDVPDAAGRFNPDVFRLMSQEAVRENLKTNGTDNREMRVGNLVMPRARFLRVDVKGYKYTVSQQSNPAVMCHLLAAYEPSAAIVTAEIQGSDAGAPFYYPNLLAKVGGRHRTFPAPAAGSLGTIAAQRQVDRLLLDGIRNYQSGGVETMPDPMLTPGMTFRYLYPRRDIDSTALALILTHSRTKSTISARDYLAGVLGGE